MNAEAGPSRLPMQESKTTSFAKMWPVDLDSPFLIVKATGVGAAAGAWTGGTYGVIKSLNPYQVSLRMGTAWGFVFFQFFALREYVVSPLLLRNGITPNHRSRYAILSHWANDGRYPPELASASTDELRSQRVLESGITGFISGGLLRVVTSGLRFGAMIPAGITGLLLASTAQYAINNLRVARLRMLAARKEGADALGQKVAVGRNLKHEQDDASPPTVDTTGRLLPVGKERSEGATGWGVLQDPTKPVADPEKSLPAKIMGVASAILPVRSLSDQEYLDVLLKKQAGVEKRLREIAEEEGRLFEQGSREEGGEKVW